MDGERERSRDTEGVIAGKVDLGPRELSASANLTDHVHLLPCVIKHEGVCPVSEYFKPRRSDTVLDGLAVEEAYFRGRKLHGLTLPIPEGYRGYVLSKKKIMGGRCFESKSGEGNSWVSCAEFQNITYWNHDSMPSKQDPMMRSFHWFDVADALSKPITAEEMASASKVGDS